MRINRAGLAVIIVGTLGACGGSPEAAPAPETVTVTVASPPPSQTETPSVTAEPSETDPSATVEPSVAEPESPPASSPVRSSSGSTGSGGSAGSDGAGGSPGSSGPESSFDREWALAKAADIIEDIGTIDERLGDGIMVSSAMRMLSMSFVRLGDAGAPPGVDAADYMARVATLESFADQAAYEYDISPIEGSARYAVVREQTEVLFNQLNSALGTNLRLP